MKMVLAWTHKLDTPYTGPLDQVNSVQRVLLNSIPRGQRYEIKLDFHKETDKWIDLVLVTTPQERGHQKVAISQFMLSPSIILGVYLKTKWPRNVSKSHKIS